MMGRIVLITGGSRSGKSRYAEEYVAQNAAKGKVAYIATSEIFDAEMEYRVKLHRERRPANWTTLEAPYDADAAIEEAGKIGAAVILFDCVTVYLNNIIYSINDADATAKNYETVETKITDLIEAAQKFSGTTVFVTNEVGSGIVPDNMLSRLYRDLAGLANQMIAADSDEVYLVVCGIAMKIK